MLTSCSFVCLPVCLNRSGRELDALQFRSVIHTGQMQAPQDVVLLQISCCNCSVTAHVYVMSLQSVEHSGMFYLHGLMLREVILPHTSKLSHIRTACIWVWTIDHPASTNGIPQKDAANIRSCFLCGQPRFATTTHSTWDSKIMCHTSRTRLYAHNYYVWKFKCHRYNTAHTFHMLRLARLYSKMEGIAHMYCAEMSSSEMLATSSSG